MSLNPHLSDDTAPENVTDTRLRQTSTAERVAKYTVISSLTGATLTAIYESTIGRARAIRELDAQRTGAASSKSPVAQQRITGGQVGNLGKHIEAAKLYRHNTALLSAAAALNSGLVAFAFFGLREHVVSPALATARSNATKTEDTDRPLTWSAMRVRNLQDSAVTGALLGGVFNTWKKGLRGILPGAFTASLACTALQLFVNELDVQRVRYVSRLEQPTSIPSSATSASPTSVAATDFEADRPSFVERMLASIGITKVDDTEYLRRLRAKRDRHLARIHELEAQIEEEKRNSGTDDRPEEGEKGPDRSS